MLERISTRFRMVVTSGKKANKITESLHFYSGFLDGARGKEPTCQCRRLRFNPWVGKIP